MREFMWIRKIAKFTILVAIFVSITCIVPEWHWLAAKVRFEGPKQNETPNYGFLGVELGDDVNTPLIVKKVFSGSGIDHSGIVPGDMIVSIDSKDTPNRKALTEVMNRTKPDQVVTVVVRRNKNDISANVKLIPSYRLTYLSEMDRLTNLKSVTFREFYESLEKGREKRPTP